ncbi:MULTISPECIES: methylenetetrahydrofolate--tRNA-(uracil(54)-C(5))-methyltransferase (FADH(2)-oxidizing) TrmFO [Caproicibacterium]|jgi:methylenetetrahydrofolate--tRNA-(uracil-5-)-methyltransferase|uniref:Methylenetetrahydrofolate--tRNA-(uracil-5-)-methyltransferase TrmFO n=1 Tax=Caproicibacterium lactatifermentans TaxID=2666138 RepID=A0A859DTE9_9FIRM|nr:methylenetetrahydrofolate--tRNA-(uracil(54)-C(5))-methyltransferase (FADH(2)-oxidizing) TrmFO [Caproicibacterium lactatifermentans]ARP50429.1 methylenetetrahydrofolate--tRNA-(uracil(54)-C(5))-methyltransferase (FADH(2)-oxidizing) TrmFO [Ruminococcaceae bacterium CPB6]MDD4807285.1 methylenetetrahydrofolate--tRNA-(uracil(54)-C(5))-methyltransferase (FADH(2)-oxidizing) TrmFO [Oscillospiraceae bacterium]QKN24779.1 methylenetetrahydrofolate--tRNA-(uracil(54)-C(5))-methyltransferase (FADH(2)-oxidiz
MEITVIGAGLAGCEAAWQIAQNGGEVQLVEMKPQKYTPAHQSPNFAELICSNSLKAERIDSAAGLLKEEMYRMGSLLVSCARHTRVPAGGALAVDRAQFSTMVTEKIRSNPHIHCVQKECTEIPKDGIVVVATGPLTSEALAAQIDRLCGGCLRFYDAAAPIVTAESLDRSRIFAASRYNKGSGEDYLNCPMNKEEYETFYTELLHAERAPLHGCDVQDPKVYEGCMPVEVMAQRGPDTIRFGPLKPVGLRDPHTGHRPWAVVQLRREDAAGTLFNLVGFQTNLKFGEQKRVFGLIPGLSHAEFVRYGVMHRNTFLNAPKVLDSTFQLRKEPRLFFAGQMTGVEGYMESASSGLLAGRNALRLQQGLPLLTPPKTTMTGALARWVQFGGEGDYQPMGANFGVMPPIEPHIRDKRERYAAISQRALQDLQTFQQENGWSAPTEEI